MPTPTQPVDPRRPKLKPPEPFGSRPRPSMWMTQRTAKDARSRERHSRLRKRAPAITAAGRASCLAAVAALAAILPGCDARPRWAADPSLRVVGRYADSDAVCDSTTPALTPPDSLGTLKPGMTVGEIEAICRELEYGWLLLEGRPQPVLLTQLGRIPVVIEVRDTLRGSRMHRVSTASSSARTIDGIGPGVLFYDVVDAWPDVRIGMGEGTFAVSATHPGISLELQWPDANDWRAFYEAQRSGDLSRLPAETKVSAVLLTPW